MREAHAGKGKAKANSTFYDGKPPGTTVAEITDDFQQMKSTALLKLVSAEIPFRGLRAFLVTFSALSTTTADLKAYDSTPDFRWTARVSPGSIGPGTNTVSFAVDSFGNSYVVTPLSGALTNGTNILINRGSLDI